MSEIVVLRQAGPTTALSVVATSHAAVTITPSDPNAGYASFLNTGATVIAVRMTKDGTTPAATLPGDSTSDTVFILPASMTMPVVYATPTGPQYQVTMIGSA